MAAEMKAVRVRLAPSPTGFFHLGTARTAIFNWLFARAHHGAFIVRIEDTDRERSRREFEDSITQSLMWLGLSWDEGPDWREDGAHHPAKGDYGPYRQSERGEVYRAALQKLLREGHAYYCYCTKEELEAERQALLAEGLPPRYSGHCRNVTAPPSGRSPQVIRFKMPEGNIEVRDLIRGTVSFDMNLVGDMVIAKDVEAPLYNFAVAVDDEKMRISHVIRGEDHLSNTPKQIALQRALGFQEPIYAHLPLILSRSRAKLSKRDMDTALLDYRTRGYLPEALVNFLALLGWHPKGNEEIFSLAELTRVFDLRRVQKSGAAFAEEKLDWVNGAHIKRMETKKLAKEIAEYARVAGRPAPDKDAAIFERAVAIEKERLVRLSDFFEASDFFFSPPEYDAALLVWQNDPQEKTLQILNEACVALNEVSPKKFSREEMNRALTPLVDREGRGSVLWPIRAALSGKRASPDPLEIMEVLGHDEAMRRIAIAIQKLTRAIG